MEDPNQIEVPPSFTALFASPSGYKLTEPMSTVRQRYELCEDLAQMLMEQASSAAFKGDLPERDVLARTQAALSGADSPVQPREAWWVTMRIAELLGWEQPDEGPPPAP